MDQERKRMKSKEIRKLKKKGHTEYNVGKCFQRQRPVRKKDSVLGETDS